MKYLLAIVLLFSFRLMSQDLEFENEILSANEIYPFRFEADSIKTCFLNIEAEKINDLISYEANNLELIDKLIALTREGSLFFYKANEFNNFIGSPMTYLETLKHLNLKDGCKSGLSIDNYIFRFEEYYSKGISEKKHLLVIGPMIKVNDKTQVLFWVHLYDMYNDRKVRKIKTKDCTANQTFYKNIDY